MLTCRDVEVSRCREVGMSGRQDVEMSRCGNVAKEKLRMLAQNAKRLIAGS